MCSFQIISQVFVPLLCAGIALLGVEMTIKHDSRSRKADQEIEKIQRAMPILINWSRGAYDMENVMVCKFSESGIVENRHTIEGFFKNTDNGIMIIDKIVSDVNDIEYKPIINSTVDKNTVIRIVLEMPNRKEELAGWRMYIRDIYNHVYNYHLIYNINDGVVYSQMLLESSYPEEEWPNRNKANVKGKKWWRR